MKIGGKIIGGYLILAALAIIMAFVSYQARHGVEESFVSVEEEALPRVETLEELRFACLRIVSSTSEYAILEHIGGPEDRAVPQKTGEEELIRQGVQSLRQALQNYEQLASGQAVEDIRLESQSILEISDGILRNIATAGDSSQLFDLKEDFERSEEKLLADISAAINHEKGKLRDGLQALQDASRNEARLFILFGVLLSVAALGIGLFLAGSLLRPLRELRGAALQFGRGNLDQRIAAAPADELGELAVAFNSMAESLQASSAELRQANEFSDNIIRSMIDGLIVSGPDGLVITVNATACVMLESSAAELLGASIREIFVAKGCSFDEVMGKMGQGGASLQKVCRDKNGREIPVLLSASFLADQAGNHQGLVLVIKDISELRLAQESLRAAHEFAQTVFNSMRDAIAIIDVRDNSIVGANHAFLAEYGLTEEEALGRPCYAVTHKRNTRCAPPDHLCPLAQDFAGTGHAVVEHVHVNEQGQRIDVEVAVAPIRDKDGRIVRAIHTSRDITVRKAAERQVLEQRDELAGKHDQLSTLFKQVELAKREWEITMDCMGAMVLLADAEGRIKRCNITFRKFAGKPFEDILGGQWEEALRATGLNPPVFAADGTEIFHELSRGWFFFRSYPLLDNTNRELPGRVLVIHDTTRLKLISQELAEKNLEIETSRAKLQVALDELSALILQVAAQKDFDVQFERPGLAKCWEIKQCGKKECPCYGREAERCWQEAGTYCGGEIQGAFAKKIGNCARCEVYQAATSDPIYLIGEQFNNMMHILKTKNQELEKAYADLQATQGQMLQQEKMASIGQLAAGVAHEINNPIGFVSSNLGTLAKYIERLTEFIRTQAEVVKTCQDQAAAAAIGEQSKKIKLDFLLEDARDLIAECLDGTKRVREIVQNLKVFSRVDQAEHKAVDLNECMESTINIVWNELKYKATLKKEYGQLPLTLCYPQQLNQVFMNLLVNAAQAIEKQGEIAVRTWLENGFINISVADTGSGIPAEHLTRIFEPFFTTKAVGKGTGLGLSIAYDIVTKKHNGEITVASELGRGTTFVVRIPVVEEK